MGICSGYYSARIYKMFKGKNLTRNTLATAMLYPSIVFSIFFILNTIIMGQKTYGAVPFLTLLEVCSSVFREPCVCAMPVMLRFLEV
jgi:transmembrane 9 superfamily protein 2/4